MDENLDEHLQAIWELEIEPYLEEYFFDDAKTVHRFRWAQVCDRLPYPTTDESDDPSA